MATQATNNLQVVRGVAIATLVLCHTTAPRADRAVPNSESVVKSVESGKRSVQLAKGGNLGHKGWPPRYDECTAEQLRSATNSAETCSSRQPLTRKGEHGGHE
jgi:hypothetical protein